MSSSKSVQDVVSNVEDYLHTYMHGHMLPKKVYVPWLTNYCAELDMSLELDSRQANYYQLQIGVLHWIVELGQVDIQTEVSMLASLTRFYRCLGYVLVVLNLSVPKIIIS